MRRGQVRPPDWARIEELVRDGQDRHFRATGRKLSVRQIGPLMRHTDGSPFGVNAIRDLVTGDRDRRSWPTMETIVAAAHFFEDDEETWKEAAGLAQRPPADALTADERRMVRMMRGRPPEEQSALVRVVEAVDDAVRVKLRLYGDLSPEAQQMAQELFLERDPVEEPVRAHG